MLTSPPTVVDIRTLPDAFRQTTVAWCGERMFASGKALVEIVDGTTVEVAATPGRLRLRACEAGTLARAVPGGVEVRRLDDLTDATRWDVGISREEFPQQVAVSPDGSKIAALSGDLLSLWERDGTPLASWPDLFNASTMLAFAPDSTVLAAGAARLTVPTLQIIDAGDGYGGEVAWGSTGRLFVGRNDALLDLDLAGRDHQPLARGLVEDPRAMALDPSGAILFVLERSGEVTRWSLDDLTLTHRFSTRAGGEAHRLAVLPDGSLLTTGRSSIARHSPTGVPLAAYVLPKAGGKALDLSADGWVVAATSSDHVHVMDGLQTGTWSTVGPYRAPGAHLGGSAEDLSVHPQGRWVAVAGRGRSEVLDLAEGGSAVPLPQLPGYDGRVRFSPDGRRLYHATTLAARVYGWPDLEATVLPRPVDSSGLAEFSPEGTTLYVSQFSAGQLHAVELGKRTRVRWSADVAYGVGAHQLDPARNRIYAAGLDLVLRAFDARTGALLQRAPSGQGGRCSSVALSKDGRYLANASERGTVALFDLRELRHIASWATKSALDELEVGEDGEILGFGGSNAVRLSPGGQAQEVQLIPTGGYPAGMASDRGLVLFYDEHRGRWLSYDIRDASLKTTAHKAEPFSYDGRISPDGLFWAEVVPSEPGEVPTAFGCFSSTGVAWWPIAPCTADARGCSGGTPRRCGSRPTKAW